MKKLYGPSYNALAPAPAGFVAAFREAFGSVQPALPKRRGTLAEHFAQLFEDSLCESSLSERRTRLPWEVFTELMRLGLRPLAQAATARGFIPSATPATA